VNNSDVTVIDAAKLLSAGEEISPARIVIEGHTISDAGRRDHIWAPSSARRVDVGPHIVVPGFIDMHIHGCGGSDVMEATAESLNVISRVVARHGTTSFLATTISSPAAVLTETMKKLGDLVGRNYAGAQPLGIHMEGPFINPIKRGTHKPFNISQPDLEAFHQWVAASQGSLRLITIAPELDPNHKIAAMARRSGVEVAMGHSNATFEEATAAIERGICYAVHTFNAMRPLGHRDPGITGAVLSDDRVTAEIIADGVHVDPAMIRVFGRAKGPSQVLLVTDATSAADMPDGEYVLGTDTVTVTNGICRDAEGRLAGSTLTQEIALKNFTGWTRLPLTDTLLALTENPARVLGLPNKGVIAAGADADLAIMDDNFHIMKTFVAGKLVFER